MELGDGDGCVQLVGELGHRLTNVAIVMDDLVDCESKLAQGLTVQGGAPADVRILRQRPPRGLLLGIPLLLVVERLSELRQEEGNPLLRLCLGGSRRCAARDLLASASNELESIVDYKLLQ